MKLEPDVTPSGFNEIFLTGFYINCIPSGLNGKVEMAAVVLDVFTPDSTP